MTVLVWFVLIFDKMKVVYSCDEQKRGFLKFCDLMSLRKPFAYDFHVFKVVHVSG